LILVYKNQVNLSRVRLAGRSVGIKSFFRQSAVAPPTVAAPIFIFVSGQTFKNGRRILQDHWHYYAAFQGVPHASFSYGHHPIVRDLNPRCQLTISRI
jgi:hypothetical protein